MASTLPDTTKSLGVHTAVEDGSGGGKKPIRWPGFVHFFFLLSVVMCALVYAPRFLAPSLTSVAGVDFFKPRPSPLARVAEEQVRGVGGGGANGVEDALVLDNQVNSPCASMPSHGICCDRSDFNTDVCFMSGDVRTDAASLSFLLFPPPHATPNASVHDKEERIRPYTRKWERHLMERIHEVRLRPARPEEAVSSGKHRCDVVHDAPALVMTAGGYTGNLFHAFNDAFLPAWLTVQHLRRRVVFVVLAYNPWWAGTFRELVSGLSDHHVIDILHDKRTHCFPAGAIVGTRFHGVLAVDPARTRDNRTLVDFHNFLANAYSEDVTTKGNTPPQQEQQQAARRPRLGIFSRKGTRVIENEAAVARLGTSVGYDVSILETANGAPLSSEYAAVSTCDVLAGVHGADLTKLLFLRPGRAALLQVAPLGVQPIARGCYAAACGMMEVHYEQYDVVANESSLSRRYAADDVVVADPERAKQGKGWDLVKQIYLSGQNVSLDLDRFGDALRKLHARALRLPVAP
ncbi:xylan glycosyltransferase MUCI21-like [Lolium rigidum]|uniref:xylan glycosyltransferase MUCI21-like n=1 Tax=Lolium rigidum TaxID=89674 RepID=UPI001F5E0C0F|nr:xylan glycosyltransferase MUCI21-like [Lolium rigidum]